MPWRPLPGIAFGIAIHPFKPSSASDLPLELGDELYIIEEGGKNLTWYRGYLVAPPSLLAGLTGAKGQKLEARVFSGIFPKTCVHIREHLRVNEQESHPTSNGKSLLEGQMRPDDASDSLQASLRGRIVKSLADSTWQESSQSANGAGKTQNLVIMTDEDSARLKPPAPVPMLRIGDETPTLASEPLVDEIAYCLREWHSTNLHELLLSRDYTTLRQLSKLVSLLDTSRRQLLHGVLTNAELITLREKIVWDLVRGNKMLRDDVVVRDPKQRGRLLISSDSPVEIAKLQSTMSLLENPPIQPQENFNLHHLMVEIKDFTSNGHVENIFLVANLSIKKGNEPLMPLTECYAMDLPPREDIPRYLANNKLRTLFSNLTPIDVGAAQGSAQALFLVVKVLSNVVQQPVNPGPINSNTMKETAISGKEIVSPTGSIKAGRRSLMWGSNKSQRQRSQGSGKLGEVSEDSQDPSSPVQTRPQTRNKDQNRIKRVIGVTVIPLEDFLKIDQDSEWEGAVWASSGSNVHTRDDIENWNDAIKDVLDTSHGTFARLQTISGLKIHLSSFLCPDAGELIRTTPTLLHEIRETQKIGFSGAPTQARSDIYVTIREPRLPDGAVFSHPERGFLQLNRSLDMHNLQLTLEVRKSNGDRVENCVFPSSDSKGLTAWRSLAIVRGEKWSQTIRLAIPAEDVPTAHLIMSIADAPGFPFALSWIPLWINGAFLQDGNHSPLLHIYDKSTSSTQNGIGAYLKLPWDPKGKEALKFESIAGPMATLGMNTYLCSTIFSQDKVLLGILRWKEQENAILLGSLRQLVFVPEIEIVKHVSGLFDALFGILVDRSGNDEVEDLVFTALVTVLGIVFDRRFKLEPLFDDYAKKRFNYPFASPCLVRSFLRLIERPADYQSSRHLRAAYKVGQHIVKFIAIARNQQMAKEASIGVTNTQPSFNRDISEIFMALEAQMRDESALAIGSKTLLVQHIHSWLPELRLCFSADEVTDLTINFINACENVQGKLIIHKLLLILNVMRSSKAMDNHVTQRVKSQLSDWLDPYWGESFEVNEQYRDQVRLCCSILSLLEADYGLDAVSFYIKILQSYSCIKKYPRVKTDSMALLFQSSYPFQTKTVKGIVEFDEILTELATMKATFSASELVQYIDTSRPDMIDIVMLSFEVDMSIIGSEAFPSSWLTLNVFHHRVIFEMLRGTSQILLQNFLPAPEEADSFNTELWRQFLLSILKLVRSDSLALENFADQKRRAVWKIGGDVREKGAELLAYVWNALGWEADLEEKEFYGLRRLGGFQVQYVPSLVAPIVDLCLSVHEGLRNVAVDILRSMIISEWSLNEDLSVVQAEIVVCLDRLFKSRGLGDHSPHKTFVNELADAFRPLEFSPDRALWESIQVLVHALDELLDLLVAAHAPEQEESHRIMHTLQLMEYLRGLQKEDMYISYIHQLATAESDSGNFKEAGLALRLHADLYDWDPADTLEELIQPVFPRQSSFERKESLYFEMIHYFEEAGAWEPALEAYRELAQQYENTSFDYAKLARTARSTARIYELIARGETSAPRYYRVIYSGLGFPATLRDKAFIFEGSASERLTNFTDRLMKQHPTAQLVNSGDVDAIEGQYLHVTPVTPHRDLGSPLYQRQKVSHSTKEFLSLLNTQRFSLTTRRHSPKPGLKGQWVDKTIFTTQEIFPTILKRSEIAHEETLSLSPLETALERTLRKSYELAILDRRVANGDASSAFALMEAIRSSVNPSSNSSIALYRDMLPLSETLADGETETSLRPIEIALQTALIDFASTLKHSLNLVEKETDTLEHRTLSQQFASTFAPELRVLAPQTQVPIALTSKQYTSTLSTTEVQKNLVKVVDENSVEKNPALSRNSRPSDSAATRRSTSIKPSSPNTPLPETPLSPGNYLQGTQKTSASIDETRSATSSRLSFHDRRKGSQHAVVYEEGISVKELTRPNVPKVNEENRPLTANSAKTSRSGKKPGSIRKRLSTLGIGNMGRKPGRGPVLGEKDRLEEE